jgi:NADH:ubiquinone oxidoreductase subunit 4 (subunit M)
MQFLEDHQWIPIIGARYQMGVDGVAILLIVLTTLLGVIAALSSWNYIQKREKEYYVLLLLLQTAVVGVFTSMDLFLFYLFFEVSLVPMYFLIGIWGGENRLYAAIKFFLYTLVGSVVMLLGVLKIYFLTQDTTLTSQITQGCRGKWDRYFQYTSPPGARICLADGSNAGTSVLCVRARLRDQGPDVSVSYLAA